MQIEVTKNLQENINSAATENEDNLTFWFKINYKF